MAKEKKVDRSAANLLWKGVDITKDFDEAADTIENVDLGEYNKERMIIYSANVNYARQLLRLSDSLKPVNRRILFTMYSQGMRPGVKKKSISVVGATTEIHPHGGASVYDTMVTMSQYWKYQCPMLRFYGQAGTETNAAYAADRYTEVSMSQFAWDCFFKDYDPDCVQTIFSTAANKYEPVSLPSRYPNILINGGVGIAVGNAFKIPPFNIDDIIRVTKEKLYNDSDKHVYLVPDFPTGCDIVDDPEAIKRICETGRGTLRVRAKSEIIDEGKHWAIRFTNLPWNVTQEAIVDNIVKATKAGILPIKDLQDRHQQIIEKDGNVVSHVDLWVLIDKAHDPYAVREKLYKRTKLEDTLSFDFKVVLEELKLDEFSLSDLIRKWIAERREYKRRLINKRIVKTTARIELLKILIELCTGTNLDKTVNIIKKSRENEIAKNLMKNYGHITSYQADQIADMRMSAFNMDALKRYKEELKEKKETLAHLFDMIKSEKYIDDIIAAELEELRKYAKPRQSQVVSAGEGKTIDTETEYLLVCTKKGGLKKVAVEAVERARKGLGNFAQQDYPTKLLRVKNMDSILFVDSFGKFSIVQAGDIDSMTPADLPMKAYNVTKLEGEIITMQYFQGKQAAQSLKKIKAGDLSLVMLTKDGMAKKIALKELIQCTDDGRKSIRNMRLIKLKKNDFLAYADYFLDDTPILLYTKKGSFNYILAEKIPVFAREAYGNQVITLTGDDSCVGCTAINPKAEFITMVTARGLAKKCEIAYLGDPAADKSTSYLCTVDDRDELIYVDSPKESITICTKITQTEYPLDNIKTLGRKAKCAKIAGWVNLQAGDNIIRIITK